MTVYVKRGRTDAINIGKIKTGSLRAHPWYHFSVIMQYHTLIWLTGGCFSSLEEGAIIPTKNIAGLFFKITQSFLPLGKDCTPQSCRGFKCCLGSSVL